MECGKNAPPMHPNCHCATAPHIDRQEFNKWLDEKETYGTSLSYEEWKKPSKYGFPLHLNLQNFAKKIRLIHLPKNVRSELNTWLRHKEIVPNSCLEFDVGDYRWYFIYKEFDEYVILKKVKIKGKERL